MNKESLLTTLEALFASCGTCIARCPVDAISLEKGKEHAPCSALLDQSQIIHAPRYGCGLCQTAVPCESGIPQK